MRTQDQCARRNVCTAVCLGLAVPPWCHRLIAGLPWLHGVTQPGGLSLPFLTLGGLHLANLLMMGPGLLLLRALQMGEPGLPP